MLCNWETMWRFGVTLKKTESKLICKMFLSQSSGRKKEDDSILLSGISEVTGAASRYPKPAWPDRLTARFASLASLYQHSQLLTLIYWHSLLLSIRWSPSWFLLITQRVLVLVKTKNYIVNYRYRFEIQSNQTKTLQEQSLYARLHFIWYLASFFKVTTSRSHSF